VRTQAVAGLGPRGREAFKKETDRDPVDDCARDRALVLGSPTAGVCGGDGAQALAELLAGHVQERRALETFVGNTAAEGIAGTDGRPGAAADGRRFDQDRHEISSGPGSTSANADMAGEETSSTTEVDANRWVNYEIKSVEIAGPLETGKAVPAKVRGILTVKQRPIERVADTTVTWIKLTPRSAREPEAVRVHRGQHQGARRDSRRVHRPRHAGAPAPDLQGLERDPAGGPI
jgi:hypothetical protein